MLRPQRKYSVMARAAYLRSFRASVGLSRCGVE
jgi:hypothetical protein